MLVKHREMASLEIGQTVAKGIALPAESCLIANGHDIQRNRRSWLLPLRGVDYYWLNH